MTSSLYRSPLGDRWRADEMSAIFSDDSKFKTWRRLWIALAEAQQELGLDITPDQIAELKANLTPINYDVANAREREARHDVMAHVYAYGVQCPKAKPIIHLGATSAFVGDNTELIQMRDALLRVRRLLVNVVDALAQYARRYKDLPTLGFTHFQPAQPTTVGKRACLWLQDFLTDLEEVEQRIDGLKFRGAKGTTGTQASFLALFDGDHEKVRQLDRLVTQKMGFTQAFSVTGQTYPRKLDAQVLGTLSGLAQSAHKMSSDVRLLQHMKEIEEPFGKSQIGSSAMAYKRNPMRCERVAALARHVMALAPAAANTAANQWFERTLDDSACRRIYIPEAFIATDVMLNLVLNVAQGLVVYPKTIANRLQAELPFMATEEILMAAVKAGGDRQALHERIREHAMEAARLVKEEGGDNDLLARIATDPAFAAIKDTMADLLSANRFVGRAPQQVEEYLDQVVRPAIDARRDLLGLSGDVRV